MKCVQEVDSVREAITVAKKMTTLIGIVARMGQDVVYKIIVIGERVIALRPRI